jgi:hypothetical protein
MSQERWVKKDRVLIMDIILTKMGVELLFMIVKILPIPPVKRALSRHFIGFS